MPYEIPIFENIGGDLANFRTSATDKCGGEACHVVEIIRGSDQDPELCTVNSITYRSPVANDPPVQNRRIQRGATATVMITCPPSEHSSKPSTPANQSPANQNPASQRSTDPTSDDQSAG